MSRTLDALKSKFAADVLATSSQYDDDVAEVRSEALTKIALFLRDDPDMAFALPCFCTVIDWLGEDGPRFHVVYHLRSLKHGTEIRLKVKIDDENPKLPTLSGVWPAFNWLEREAFDMYGVRFDGHPDLRRIYLYEEFVGYPLRKDYPKDKRQPLVRREWNE